MTPRSPPRMLAGHCDRYVVTAHGSAGPGCRRGRRQPVSATRCILRRTRTGAPRRQGLHIGTWVTRARLSSPVLAFPVRRCGRPPQRTSLIARSSRPEENIIVTYVDRTLNCVDCGVEFIHSAADQEYYVAEGVRERPEALHQLPRQPTRRPRRWLRRPRHRWPARLRARRRPRQPRVLRGHLLVLRQPGAGPVQAAHGPPGLLLGLLPDASAPTDRRRVIADPRRPGLGRGVRVSGCPAGSASRFVRRVDPRVEHDVLRTRSERPSQALPPLVGTRQVTIEPGTPALDPPSPRSSHVKLQPRTKLARRRMLRSGAKGGTQPPLHTSV